MWAPSPEAKTPFQPAAGKDWGLLSISSKEKELDQHLPPPMGHTGAYSDSKAEGDLNTGCEKLWCDAPRRKGAAGLGYSTEYHLILYAWE